MADILEGRIVTWDDNEVSDIRGIDMGAEMLIIKVSHPFIAFRRIGHVGWSGVGSTKYYPPVYFLIQISNDTQPRILRVIERIEVDRSTWRKVRGRILSKMDKLNQVYQYKGFVGDEDLRRLQQPS